MTRHSPFKFLIALAIAVTLASFVGIAAATTYPTNATIRQGRAVVDGSPAEWFWSNDASTADQQSDFFAFMYRAGRALDKPVESMLSMRYSCSQKRAYVLVIAKSGVKILVSGDQYVKFGQNSVQVSAGRSDFRFVGQSGDYADGWEASFPMTSNVSGLNVHAQVFDGGSQTSAVDQRSIPAKIPSCTTGDPDIAIAVTPSPSRSGRYEWSLDKTASPTAVSGSEPITYTVQATRSGPTDVQYTVSGSFSATSATALSGAAVDLFTTGPGAAACTVTSEPSSGINFAANVGQSFPFTCDPTSAAPTSVTARVLVPSIGTWAASSAINWATAPATYLHEQIYISDPESGGASLPTSASPYSGTGTSWTYNKTWDVPASGCLDKTNTATLASNDTPFTAVTRSSVVQVCAASAITVDGTADPSYTRTYRWTLTKFIDDLYPCTTRSASLEPGTVSCGIDWTSPDPSTTVPYTVTATKNPQGDSAFTLTGSFTLSGEGASPPSSSLDSVTSSGFDCSLTREGSPVTLPVVVGSYTPVPTYAFACTGTGTATASTTGDVVVSVTPAESSASIFRIPFDFADAVVAKVNDSAKVTDTFNSGAPTVLDLSTDSSGSWPVPRVLTSPLAGGACIARPNTAAIYLDGSASPAATVTRIVRICPPTEPPPPTLLGLDIEVHGSYTRVWSWNIVKRLEGVGMISPSPGGAPKARLSYRVALSESPGDASDVEIHGTAHVTDSLGIPLNGHLSVTIPGVNGEICYFESSNVITLLPDGATTHRDFTCSLDEIPSGPITPRVLLTQDGTPSQWGAGGTVDFTSPTQVTVVDQHKTVALYDNFNRSGEQNREGWSGITSDAIFRYTNDVVLGSRDCVEIPNVARLYGVSPRPSATWVANYCPDVGVPEPLRATLRYSTRAARDWSWSLSKQITSTEIIGNNVRVAYSVSATRSSIPLQSDFSVNGTLFVTNPNPWRVSGASVVFRYTPDTFGDIPDCRIDGSATLTRSGLSLAGNQTIAIAFTCSVSTLGGGQVSATLGGGDEPVSVFGGPPGRVAFTSIEGAQRNESVDVFDAFNGAEEVTLVEGISATQTFSYVKILPLANGCQTFANLARLVGDNGYARAARSSVQVCLQTNGDVLVIRSSSVEKIGRVVSSTNSSDTSQTNNTSSGNGSSVTSGTRLVISKTGPGTARRGQVVTYRVTVTNNTTGAASGAVVTDALPRGMVFLRGRLPSNATLVNARVATFALPTIPAGGSVTLRYSARVKGAGLLCNRANVKATGFSLSRDSACIRVSGTVTPPVVTG